MSLINALFTFTSQHTRFEHPWRLPFGSNVMDGLNVTYALGVSVSFSMDVVVYVLGMCMRQMLVSWLSVLPVPLPLLSWRALMHLAAFGTLSSPLLLCYTRTSTSTISQDKLGFSDFLQILLQIRENNLKKKNPRTDRGMSIKEPFWKPQEKNHSYKSQSCQALVCRRDDWPQHHPVALYYFWFLHSSIALFAETHLSHSRRWTPSYHRGCVWKCDNILFWKGADSLLKSVQ